MNPGCCGFCKRKIKTYEVLKEEYDCIKFEMLQIREAKLSDTTKNFILRELQEQINVIKEKMHDYIDTL